MRSELLFVREGDRGVEIDRSDGRMGSVAFVHDVRARGSKRYLVKFLYAVSFAAAAAAATAPAAVAVASSIEARRERRRHRKYCQGWTEANGVP